jgi:hypothetical protein
MRKWLPLLVFGVVTSVSADPVYKWVDDRGVVHYSDKPVDPRAKPVYLPGIQIYGTRASKSDATGKRPEGPLPFGGSGPRVQILQPAADATLGAEGKFMVSVSVSPGLSGTQKFNYYLNGEAVTPAPTASRAFLYTGVEQGDHLLSVGVVDGGRELSRSEPVMVHVRPTAAVAAP